MPEQENKIDKSTILIRVIACTLILLSGFGGLRFLKSRKKPPAHQLQVESPLKVTAQSVYFSDVPVQIEAHGQLRSLRTVEIAAEVAGSVTEVHPRLQSGEVIQKGELLFAIDDRDYSTEYESSKSRLQILKRDKELTADELKRVRTLFEKSKVGTQAGVEKAEQAANSSADRFAQVQQSMIRAQINLERCRVYAPFTCRITSKKIEKGQYVTPGKIVLNLADDSVLELEVPVDSGDALRWLQFSDRRNTSQAWFSPLTPVECQVIWTEDENNKTVGILNRVSLFDEKTRTVKIIIRIEASQMETGFSSMPLVAGMFCRVLIPGATMKGVARLPRHAVSFENSVYVVKEGRLNTVPVNVARRQDNYSYIKEGLAEGDQVITTRLVNPMERSLVKVVNE